MSKRICLILMLAAVGGFLTTASSEAAKDTLLSLNSVQPLPPYGQVDQPPVFVKLKVSETKPTGQVLFTGTPLDDVVRGLADRLVALQDPIDAGWELEVTGDSAGSTSDLAMYNVGGGLLAAYQANPEVIGYLDAAKAAGDALVALQSTWGWLYYEDIVFLYDLYDETGILTYQTAADAAMIDITGNTTAQGSIDHALSASQNVSYHIAWAALAHMKANETVRAETLLDSGAGSLSSQQSSEAGIGNGSFLSKGGFVQDTVSGDLYGMVDTAMAIIAFQTADNMGIGADHSAQIDAALFCIEGNVDFFPGNEGAIPDALWWNLTGFENTWTVPNWQYKSQSQGVALWAANIASDAGKVIATGLVQILSQYLQETVIVGAPAGGFHVRPAASGWSTEYLVEYSYDDALMLRGLAMSYPDITVVDDSEISNGYNLFTTIQAGIDGVGTSGYVRVDDGTYSENLSVYKPLKIIGIGEAVLQGTGTGTGVSIEGVSAGVLYMRITNFDYAIDINASGDAFIRQNNIFENNLYGVRNQNTGTTVDAENNWWGTNNGPDDDAGVINGSGDKTSLYVDATPYKTGILPVDSDGDGVPNGLEDLNGNGIVDAGEMNPILKDTDGDGVEDGVEIALGTDPTDSGSVPASPPSSADTDGDGYKDYYEVAMGTDMNSDSSYPVLGDVNADGNANNVDAIIIFQISLGNVSITSFPVERMDLNRDGIINNTDAIILFQWSLGNVAAIPIP